MSKFTPGPWEFTKSDQSGDVCFDIHQADGAPYTPNFLDVSYCRVFHTCSGELVEIQEANSRLIAAAPDLLEVCNLFIKYDQTNEADGLEMMFAYKALKVATHAAIAKATGTKS